MSVTPQLFLDRPIVVQGTEEASGLSGQTMGNTSDGQAVRFSAPSTRAGHPASGCDGLTTPVGHRHCDGRGIGKRPVPGE